MSFCRSVLSITVSSETLDVRMDGKSHRLRIRAGDVDISRLPPVFHTPYCKTGLDWIRYVKRGIGIVEETWYISKTKLGAGRLECNGVFKEKRTEQIHKIIAKVLQGSWDQQYLRVTEILAIAPCLNDGVLYRSASDPLIVPEIIPGPEMIPDRK